MYRPIARRLRRLEMAAGARGHAMALVRIYSGEILDEALARQAIDREAFDGLFIIEGLERPAAARV